MDIEFAGRFDGRSFWRAMLLASSPSRGMALLRIVCAIGLAGIFVVWAALALQEDMSGLELARGGRRLVSVAIGLFVLLQPWLGATWQAIKLWRRPSSRTPEVGRITTSGITYRYGDTEHEIAWGRFARLRQSNNLVSMLTADGTLAAFSRSFFKSETDWSSFRRLAEFKVKEAK